LLANQRNDIDIKRRRMDASVLLVKAMVVDGMRRNCQDSKKLLGDQGNGHGNVKSIIVACIGSDRENVV
jgi:hypothetical protein